MQSSGLAPTVNKEGVNASTTSGNRNPALWPPLRLPNAPIPSVGCDPRQITRCGRLHAALLAVLHRAAHRCRPPPEHVLALAVFLLEVAVDVEKEAQENKLPVKEVRLLHFYICSCVYVKLFCLSNPYSTDCYVSMESWKERIIEQFSWR